MRIGVITFPGSLDDRDAARAVRLAGAEPVLAGLTGEPGVAVVVSEGVPLTTDAVSPFTKPVIV